MTESQVGSSWESYFNQEKLNSLCWCFILFIIKYAFVYLQTLEQAGHRAILVPVLAFNFINQEKLAQALQNAHRFSGIILTSPRAVQAVTKALSLLKGQCCYEKCCCRWSLLYRAFSALEQTHKCISSRGIFWNSCDRIHFDWATKKSVCVWVGGGGAWSWFLNL